MHSICFEKSVKNPLIKVSKGLKSNEYFSHKVKGFSKLSLTTLIVLLVFDEALEGHERSRLEINSKKKEYMLIYQFS